MRYLLLHIYQVPLQLLAGAMVVSDTRPALISRRGRLPECYLVYFTFKISYRIKQCFLVIVSDNISRYSGWIRKYSKSKNVCYKNNL